MRLVQALLETHKAAAIVVIEETTQNCTAFVRVAEGQPLKYVSADLRGLSITFTAASLGTKFFPGYTFMDYQKALHKGGFLDLRDADTRKNAMLINEIA